MVEKSDTAMAEPVKAEPADEEPEEEITWLIFSRIMLMYYLVWMGDAARGIVLPTMVHYCESLLWGTAGAPAGENNFLAWNSFCIAGFSLGRAIASPFQGAWADIYGVRGVLLVSTTIFMLGEILYALADGVGTGHGAMVVMLISRIIIGVGSGQLGVLRGYVAEMVPVSKRTTYLAYLNLAQFIGFTFTASLGPLLDFTIPGLESNKFTNAGYFMAICALLALVGMCFLFPPSQPKEDVEQPKVEAKPQRTWITELTDFTPTYQMAAMTLLMSNLVVRANLAVFESLLTDIAQQDFNYNESQRAGVFTILGVVGMICFLFIDPIKSRINSRYTIILGFVLMGLGDVCFFHWGFTSTAIYMTGALLNWSIGYPIAQTMLMVVFADVLGKKKKATFMAIFGIFGSVGRVIAPLWVSALPKSDLWVAFVIPFLLVCGLLYFINRMFDAIKSEKETDSEQAQEAAPLLGEAAKA